MDSPIAIKGVSAIADALRDVGFTVEALSDVLGIEKEFSSRDVDKVVYERRLLNAPEPLAEVIAFLTLGIPLHTDRLPALFGADGARALIDSGAAIERESQVDATVRLIPHGDLYICSDRPLPSGDGDPTEPLHVTGINAPAGLLASLTVRKPVERALDIGTGNGIQALLAAKHSRRVFATDVNPRALAFASFNAALNGIHNIEFAEGSLFGPVGDERFDLIVCNPPYVISPDSDYAYRDSGEAPGAFCRALIGAIPAHLVDGGYATVLASWPARVHEDWWDVPESWLQPGALAWLLHYRTEDPLTHASLWNRPLAAVSPSAYAESIDRWLAFYREQAIEGISFGALLLHGSPEHSGVIRRDPLKIGEDSAGRQIERAFTAFDDLSRDPAVLDRRFMLAEGTRLEQSFVQTESGWTAERMTLRVTEGIVFEGTLDATMAQVLLGLDGQRSGREAACAVADAVELEDLDQVLELTESMILELYSLGLLLPVTT
jgi:protein-L-isoaspartate O-methyltransferase